MIIVGVHNDIFSHRRLEYYAVPRRADGYGLGRFINAFGFVGCSQKSAPFSEEIFSTRCLEACPITSRIDFIAFVLFGVSRAKTFRELLRVMLAYILRGPALGAVVTAAATRQSSEIPEDFKFLLCCHREFISVDMALNILSKKTHSTNLVQTSSTSCVGRITRFKRCG